jgi:hypothetical protein
MAPVEPLPALGQVRPPAQRIEGFARLDVDMFVAHLEALAPDIAPVAIVIAYLISTP